MSLLRTRGRVKKEAFAITSEACQLDKSYRVLYAPVKTLSKYYRDCKNQVFFFRYGSLKKMIKDCIDMYRLSKKFKKAMEPKASDNDIAREDIEDELEDLSKGELLEHSEDMKDRIKQIKEKIQLLDTLITDLETKYAASKQRRPIARYYQMKQIVKTLIRTAAQPANVSESDSDSDSDIDDG